MSPPTVAVVHAYSRANSGDGLLVDLTLERLARAGVPADSCTVVALDPASFADTARTAAVGTPGRAADLSALVAAGRGLALVAGARRPALARSAAARAVAGADLCVAVGGGYLRTGTRVNSVGTALNHLPQLLAVARGGRPSVYLPQSIGPLAGPVGRRVARALAGVGSVHVRDDRSRAELAGLANVTRTPDLAVLDLAERWAAGAAPVTAAGDGPTLLIGRALPDAPAAGARLRALAERLGEVAWAVQAEGSAAKSDRTFYQGLGVPVAGRTGELLRRGGWGAVVSVRLHGALEALLAGYPAVHLGYERKSWGAYQDLGLAGHVHSARAFDPGVVADQVAALRADPGPFWAALGAEAEPLRERSEALTADLAAAVERAP
ncbi:MAG TPA: polysaccharide pyruvyl transferase family protein [Acidimicrobiales bacterium]|nr:polysaccharide pyruvyl transferase family protein [Acidimicrobiales bacterium]